MVPEEKVIASEPFEPPFELGLSAAVPDRSAAAALELSRHVGLHHREDLVADSRVVAVVAERVDDRRLVSDRREHVSEPHLELDELELAAPEAVPVDLELPMTRARRRTMRLEHAAHAKR